MLTHFVHHKHICIIFELLSCSLFDIVTKSKSLSLPLIRKFAYQLLNTLTFLQDEEIIHSDLKPENILLRQSNMTGIKVIDFGCSCRKDENVFGYYVQSRYYRAPEVLLGMDYSYPIDIWSLGCILVELHTGVPLFPGRDCSDQVKRIIELTGIPSNQMLSKCSRKHIYLQYEEGQGFQLLPNLVIFLFFLQFPFIFIYLLNFREKILHLSI